MSNLLIATGALIPKTLTSAMRLANGLKDDTIIIAHSPRRHGRMYQEKIRREFLDKMAEEYLKSNKQLRPDIAYFDDLKDQRQPVCHKPQPTYLAALIHRILKRGSVKL